MKKTKERRNERKTTEERIRGNMKQGNKGKRERDENGQKETQNGDWTKRNDRREDKSKETKKKRKKKYMKAKVTETKERETNRESKMDGAVD